MSALKTDDYDMFELRKGVPSIWLTIDNVSVWIVRTNDGNVKIETYQRNQELGPMQDRLIVMDVRYDFMVEVLKRDWVEKDLPGDWERKCGEYRVECTAPPCHPNLTFAVKQAFLKKMGTPPRGVKVSVIEPGTCEPYKVKDEGKDYELKVRITEET